MSSRTAIMVIPSTPHTTVFNPTLPAPRRDPMRRPVGHLIGHVARVRALTGFGDQWLTLTADPRLRNAAEALLEYTVDDAVLDLLGRGPGLTPSGDDVLVGMIAALWFVGEIDSSSLAPLSRLLATDGFRLTTDISAEYLRYACRGMVTGALRDLLFALDRSDSRMTADAVDQLRRHGHTSGMDCLLGVLTCLRHIATEHAPAPASYK